MMPGATCAGGRAQIGRHRHQPQRGTRSVPSSILIRRPLLGIGRNPGLGFEREGKVCSIGGQRRHILRRQTERELVGRQFDGQVVQPGTLTIVIGG